MMKKIVFFTLIFVATITFAQEVRLAKGTITEGVKVNDTLQETYSIYLPTTFDISKTWPVIFVFDMTGNSKNAMAMLLMAAEEEGYILAGSDNLSDSLSIAQNVLIVNRMFNAVINTVPVADGRSYTAGFDIGARFASLVPMLIKNIEGVISIGASIGDVGILNTKQSFQFIGIVNRFDYNFSEMIASRKVLDRVKFPNQLLSFDNVQLLPDRKTMAFAMRMLTMTAMAKEVTVRNDSLISKSYNQLLAKANSFVSNGKPILADYMLSDMERIFNPLLDENSLKATKKSLRRSATYKKANRSQNNYFLQESFTKEDYGFYLTEDISTYNYTNLGWWTYQMEELDKLDNSAVLYERQMSSRLRGYINALIADNIDFIRAGKEIDEEALNFSYMLKTITAPKEYANYLKVISNSAKIEDFGTALFYLEELLKNGYTDKLELYNVEHTGLLRITPEFNELVAKYLNDARYDLIEQ